MLQSFFGQFAEDAREVSFEFELPFVNDGANYAFTAPSLQFWFALSVCLLLQTIVGIVCMLVAWVLIKKNRQENPTMAFVACYGLLCPAALYLPFALLPFLNIPNTVLATPFVGLAISNALHFLEILYDTSPPFAEKTISNFLLYHASPVMLRFHPKTQEVTKATTDEMRHKLQVSLFSFCSTVVLLNVLLITSYEPFGHHELTSVADYFNWRHLGNNMANAYLIGTNLETGTLIFGVIISFITGYSTIYLNDSPFTKSTSVADFWGRRWNIQIGGLLKNSIFKSCVKNGVSRLIAVLLTFAMSALMHEYVIQGGSRALVNPTRIAHDPAFGRQSAFFLWNGMMMVLERLIMSNTSIKSAWDTSIPAPIKTVCIVMTSLPISRWFMDDFIGMYIFDDFVVAFPKIRKL